MKLQFLVLRHSVAVASLGLALLAASGCSRNFWRTQADFDSLNLLEQKQFDPRWDIPRTTVDADQRSRFYDPFNLDFEPLPPDDPAANQYMNWIYGMRGYKGWHRFGQSMSVENPQWLDNFGVAPETFHNVYRETDGLTTISVSRKLNSDGSENLIPTIENLTLQQAIELAAIHSRDYQTQIENLFLSSLQLSLDQFQFNVRYLGIGGKTPTGAATYSDLPGGTSNMLFASQGGISQVLPTGGQWIVGLANNTLWLFSGGKGTASQSILSYSLVQPLLQGAGRKVILENLTASERNVLYNIRLLARYRKLFFADTVVNTGGGSTSSAAAITAASGSLSANPTVISTNAGISVAPGTTVGSTSAAAATPAGYYGMLLQLQRVLNQHENVEYLRVQTERLRELVAQTPFRRLGPDALPNGIQFPPALAAKIEYSPATRRLRWTDDAVMTAAERETLLTLSNDPQYVAAVRALYDQLRVGVTTLDILQVATNLTAAQVQERALALAFNDEIDQYKFFLGLPIDMQITIDRTLLQPFQLTDPRLVDTEGQVLDFIKQTSRINDSDPFLSELRQAADRFAELVELVRVNGMQVVEEDFRRVQANSPRRLSQLISDESREIVKRALERDSIIFSNVQTDFREVTATALDFQKRLAGDDVPQKVRAEVLGAIKDTREDLLVVLQNLRLLQVGQRTELINLEEFTMDIDEVVGVALENRLDLMNARGKVMDARRNMEVAANRLEAVVNVVAQGNLNTPPQGSHPLDFSGAYSTFQFGLQMSAPLDQMQARNLYRGSLVTYQQARRSYMLLEDQVKYDVRTSWRQLMANRQNFEASRKNLRQAAFQFDINVANNLNPRPQGQAAGQAGTTTLSGATGLNLIQATSSLLNAQNNLILYWISYERNRINIYRDMDIMQIDERGLWIDPVYQNLDGRSDSPAEEPSNVTPPEPATVKSFGPHESEGTDGIVRLARRARPGVGEISVEEAHRSDASAGRFGHWWRGRLAGNPVAADAAAGRDRRADH